MSQLDFIENIGNEWVEISDSVSFTANDSYILQNRGAGLLLLCESATEPSTEAGHVLPLYEEYEYICESGIKLYAKALCGTCALNIDEGINA